MAQYRLFYSTVRDRERCQAAYELCHSNPESADRVWTVDLADHPEDHRRLTHHELPALKFTGETGPPTEFYGDDAIAQLKYVLGLAKAPVQPRANPFAGAPPPPGAVLPTSAVPGGPPPAVPGGPPPAPPAPPAALPPAPPAALPPAALPPAPAPAYPAGYGAAGYGAAGYGAAHYPPPAPPAPQPPAFPSYINHMHAMGSGVVAPTVPPLPNLPVIDTPVEARYILYTTGNARPDYVPISGIVEVMRLHDVRAHLRSLDQSAPDWMDFEQLGRAPPILATFEDNPTVWYGVAAVDYCQMLRFLGPVRELTEAT